MRFKNWKKNFKRGEVTKHGIYYQELTEIYYCEAQSHIDAFSVSDCIGKSLATDDLKIYRS
ncbi:uncharacterized protein YrrD [Pedobacter sp. UYP30]